LSIPNLYLEKSGSALTDLIFEPRPLGSVGAAQTVSIWNDKAVAVTGESVGTGDGTTAAFALDHANLLSGQWTIKVDGTTKTDGTDYTMTPGAGTFVFSAGAVPASGAAITADYVYGTGAGGADTVYVLVRRRTVGTGDGSRTSFSLPTAPVYVYEVLVDAAVASGWSVSGSAVVFGTAPAGGANVEIWYEDEAVGKAVVQLKSSGTSDPYSAGIVDDAATGYTSIGGSVAVTGESVGTGDGTTTTFALDHAPVVSRSVAAKVAGTATECTVHWLLGEIEFSTPPASGAAITADYRYFTAARLGAIPAHAGRTLSLRGRAPTVTTASGLEGILSVEGI